MSRIRKPRAETGLRISTPSSDQEIPDDRQPPVFCFRFLQKAFCVSDCQQEEKAALADKLHQMSQLTWEQLRQAGRMGQGYEIISRSAIQAPVPGNLTEDVRLLAFRFYGKAPMVGYRARRVFHVLWLDRGCTLYNHGS